MGDIPAVISLLDGPGADAKQILAVIDPPLRARDRSSFIATSGVSIPGVDEWRHMDPIGADLKISNQIVRSNHFKIDTSRICKEIYQYHVNIREISR